MTWSTECSFRDCCWCFCFHWICLGFAVFCLLRNQTHSRVSVHLFWANEKPVYVWMRRANVCSSMCMWVGHVCVCVCAFAFAFVCKLMWNADPNEKANEKTEWNEIKRSAYSTQTKYRHAMYWASLNSTWWTSVVMFVSIRYCTKFPG